MPPYLPVFNLEQRLIFLFGQGTGIPGKSTVVITATLCIISLQIYMHMFGFLSLGDMGKNQVSGYFTTKYLDIDIATLM